MLWAPKVGVLMLANSRLSRRHMSDEHDYREQYNEAIARAVAGQVGVYPDFDRHRQETVWRGVSSPPPPPRPLFPPPGVSGGGKGNQKKPKKHKTPYHLMGGGRPPPPNPPARRAGP